jgi:hypothetical protein
LAKDLVERDEILRFAQDDNKDPLWVSCKLVDLDEILPFAQDDKTGI